MAGLSGGTATQQRDLGRVEIQVQAYARLCDHLQGLIGGLEERIRPILEPEAVSETSAKAPNRPQPSGLAAVLEYSNEQFSMACERLNQIILRVEL